MIPKLERITIRKTKNSKAIRALEARCFPEDEPYDIAGAIWWLVKVGDFPIGYAGLKPLPYEKDVGFLCRAGILSNYRGQGLQRKLIKLRIKEAQKLGLKQLVTYTTTDNYASITNLLNQGFRFYSPENPWAGKEAKTVMYFYKHLTQ